MDFNSFRKEINSKNASVKELVNEFFLKIDTKDPEINSYICTTKSNAISQADNIDKLIQNQDTLPPLAGIPIAIKDNICSKGVATTCASKMLKSFVSPYESTASSKLWSAGGICWVKQIWMNLQWVVPQRPLSLVLLLILGILIESLEGVLEAVLLQLQPDFVWLL